LAATAGDPHTDVLAHFALAFGKHSELSRLFSDGVGPFAQQLGADPLGWIGDGVALYLDRTRSGTSCAQRRTSATSWRTTSTACRSRCTSRSRTR
jgi:hypothetical protein